MIELHGARTGNCLRVSVALEETGLPYQVHRVDLRRGQHVSESHRALNPDGKVPTIVDDEGPSGRLVLSQSNAILFYLAERAPGVLLPLHAAARAIALERFFFVLTDVIGPSHAAFRLGKGSDLSAEALVRYAAAGLAKAEGILGTAPFIAGDAFGLADIAAVTTLPSVFSEADLDALPRVSAWYQQSLHRPSVARGMRVFDAGAPNGS